MLYSTSIYVFMRCISNALVLHVVDVGIVKVPFACNSCASDSTRSWLLRRFALTVCKLSAARTLLAVSLSLFAGSLATLY
jgi:hypothetical protein